MQCSCKQTEIGTAKLTTKKQDIMFKLKSNPARKIDEIIIHCSDTRPDQDITAKDIHTWHKKKGWDGIGYHFFIRRDGTLEAGRPINREGAHCYGHNKRSIGICYAGGVNRIHDQLVYEDNRTTKQLQTLYQLVKTLLIVYPSIEKISGHNTYSNKKCPCFNVEDEFDLFLKQVREQMQLFNT